jgi:hypothetical protein
MINVRNEAQQCLLDQVTAGRLSRRKFLSISRSRSFRDGKHHVALIAWPGGSCSFASDKTSRVRER